MSEDEYRPKPWGVHSINRMYHRGASTTVPGFGEVRAVSEPYALSLFDRLIAAWWVFTGQAEAMVWPKDGDLERVFIPKPKEHISQAKSTTSNSP